MLRKALLFGRILAFGLLVIVSSCKEKTETPVETWEEISGLNAPLGMARDAAGRIWVTEAGTGSNDGRLTMISLSGQKITALAGLPSVVANGNVEGLGRPYVKGNSLFFAHGISGVIYKLKSEIGSISETQLPFGMSDFEVYNVGDFARGLPTSADANSNVMDLHLADNGDLYILDAGANAIIKKERNSETYSLFAEFPKLPTAAPFPVSQDAVPTSFVFDGTRFLVSTLSSVPFNPEAAKIFSVSTTGQVSVYKSDFTNLIHLELDNNNKPVALQYSLFSLETGFQNSSGNIKDENGAVLLSGIHQPTDIVRKDNETYYLLSYGDGTIKKVEL